LRLSLNGDDILKTASDRQLTLAPAVVRRLSELAQAVAGISADKEAEAEEASETGS
jgi:hypothetical protein